MKTTVLDHFYIENKMRGWTDGHKIMIIMHGLGDSLESYKLFTQELNVSGLNYFLLNAPKKYYFGYSWYDIPPGNPHPGIENSVELLLKVIKELNEQGYHNRDILLAGFSQGGCIALETLYKLKSPLAGVVALSPRIYEDRYPKEISFAMKNTPIFCAHGNFDPVIPFGLTEKGILYLQSKGMKIDFHDYDMEHEIDHMEIVELREWVNERI